jgi:hypothetical protein
MEGWFMRIHRFAAIAALVAFAVLAASCAQDSGYCEALDGTPSIFCPSSSAPSGRCVGSVPGSLLWACNLDQSLAVPSDPAAQPGECGLLFCGETSAGAPSTLLEPGDPDPPEVD